jgi:pimeloyl-ACP methyl ester carboxylesterase
MPNHPQEPSHWVHGVVETSPGVKIHYTDVQPAESHDTTLILIHGYPQTSYEFRHVIQPFVNQGYRVIAPDYRGAGDSSRPRSGYDKFTMAADIFNLYTSLGIQSPIILGHDIGSMIAVCLALKYESSISALICMGEVALSSEAEDQRLRSQEHRPMIW